MVKQRNNTVLIDIVTLAFVLVALVWGTYSRSTPVHAQTPTTIVSGKLVEYRNVPVATCKDNSANSWSNWDGVTSADNANNEAVYLCSAGASSPIGYLKFYDAGSSSGIYRAYNHFWLPADWTSTIDLRFSWATTATTGNAVWQVQTACYASAANYAATSWNTAQTITSAALGTGSRLIFVTQVGITTTGCTAGNLFKYRIVRDATNVGDTIAADALLFDVEWTVRRLIGA